MRPGLVDTTFDIRSDAGGKDPDRYSPTLRRYHQLLWGKPLPSGAQFDLEDVYPHGYLRHRSRLGEFRLSSDMINRTFRHMRRARPLIQAVPEAYLSDFGRRGCTVGGTIIFPANRIDEKHTINQARGVNRRIEDRFDLTLECIRCHYLGEPNPLDKTLHRYAAFFELFEDFTGYVSHFLLQDLVADDGSVRLFLGAAPFETPAIPRSVEEYMEYSKRAIDFVEARNRRIRAWLESQPV